MKAKIFVVALAIAGLSSCAQRSTCPTYSKGKVKPNTELAVQHQNM